MAIREDGTMTVVPVDYPGGTAERMPLVVLKPIRHVTEFPLQDFALRDERLVAGIEEAVRSAGGQCSREAGNR